MTAKAADNKNPEQPTPEGTQPAANPTPAAPAKPLLKSLYFPEGFWCVELNRSFAMGYYRPKNEKEMNILNKYAGKEFNNLKPSM